MYQTILVPLDGSKRAEMILPHVIDMAHRYDAEIILLQVLEYDMPLVTPYDALVDIDPAIDMLEEKAMVKEYLDDLGQTLEGKGLRIRCRVEIGPVVDTIINVAKEMEADMIAMASHGRSGLARVIYGSVAAGVLQKIDRPLFLIRAQ